MSKHAKHVPTHRGAPKSHAALVAPRKALRNTLVVSSVAVAVTGVTVGGGLLGSSNGSVATAAADLDTTVSALPTSSSDAASSAASSSASPEVERGPVLSRSSDRLSASRTTDPTKAAALATDSGPAVSGSQSLADADPRDIGRALLSSYGWSEDQFGCLDSLWTKESGWNVYADNPSSSAYGIPQSLPGSKMASVGADWATNPVTQIKWGLGYIASSYGSPCGAWAHSESYNWY